MAFEPRTGGQMSEKEATLLSLVAKGYRTREIAAMMNISRHHVYYLSKLLKVRLGVDTYAALIGRAIAEGIIDPDGTLINKQRSDAK